MDATRTRIAAFLRGVHPYDTLPPDELVRVAGCFGRRETAAGEIVYRRGEAQVGLYLIERGAIEVIDANGEQVSALEPGNSFGERGLMCDGLAQTTARAAAASVLLVLPPSEFRRLVESFPAFARFFARRRPPAAPRESDLATLPVTELMVADPVTCTPDTSILDAARMMRDRHISCLGVVEAGRLTGIVTLRDLATRAVAEAMDSVRPVRDVMTPRPEALPPTALGSDVLHVMLENRVGHLPIAEGGRLLGIITQTDLTRFQAISSAQLIREIAGAASVAGMTAVTARIPQLLSQLVLAGNRHEVVTRLITDIADAVTRRLLKKAEAELGPPPVPYLWLACGSQGRQEQTGVSDQDNCLILDDAATPADDAWFAELARIVSNGLNACGYFHCPGDMMATNPRWRQPLATWRRYFEGWIATPSPEAQMLSSVMFDLRPIGGTTALFAALQEETLERAARNSIFVAHIIANSLKHVPPLGLLRGFATIRSGEHKDRLDLKLNGVVPVVDLGRVYALTGRIRAVNTRARLGAAEALGVVSPAGGQSLIDAYDLIATTRLEHQARRVREGLRPDNFMAPSDLSDLERSHLRDAFVVVRTMQSALAHGKAMPG